MPQQDIDREEQGVKDHKRMHWGAERTAVGWWKRMCSAWAVDVGVELVVGMGGAVARVGYFRGFSGFEGWRGSGYEPRVVQRWGRERQCGHAC
jgi:hypothetical protein